MVWKIDEHNGFWVHCESWETNTSGFLYSIFSFFICFKYCIRVYITQIYEVILCKFLMCIRWDHVFIYQDFEKQKTLHNNIPSHSLKGKRETKSKRGGTRMKEKTNSRHAHLLIFSTFNHQSSMLRGPMPSLPRMRQLFKRSAKAQKTKIIKTLTWPSYLASNHGKKQC